MPIVASSGAMRGEPCSGRSPMRSIATPISAEPAITIASVTGSGVCRYVTHSQPI